MYRSVTHELAGRPAPACTDPHRRLRTAKCSVILSRTPLHVGGPTNGQVPDKTVLVRHSVGGNHGRGHGHRRGHRCGRARHPQRGRLVLLRQLRARPKPAAAGRLGRRRVPDRLAHALRIWRRPPAAGDQPDRDRRRRPDRPPRQEARDDARVRRFATRGRGRARRQHALRHRTRVQGRVGGGGEERPEPAGRVLVWDLEVGGGGSGIRRRRRQALLCREDGGLCAARGLPRPDARTRLRGAGDGGRGVRAHTRRGAVRARGRPRHVRGRLDAGAAHQAAHVRQERDHRVKRQEVRLR